jgi:HEAT repeat protein
MIRRIGSAFLLMALVGMPSAWAEQGKRSVANLIGELRKADADKLKAIEELAALGENARAAAPALVQLLSVKNEDVRLHATMALGKIGASAVGPLSKAYESKDPATRFYAIWGLAFIGAPAKSAAPIVLKAMNDPAPDVRRKAAYTLVLIQADPDATVAALVHALGDKDNDVRQTAIETLPKLGSAAVPVLLKALRSEKDSLKPIAITLLGAIGAPAEEAIPDLKAILLEYKSAANAAADALAGIGAASVKALNEAANSDNPNVRALAINSLHKIGAPAVPSFVDMLGAKHVDVQRRAASLLGTMQVFDKSVVIALGYATKDKDHQVRSNALHSIRAMGSSAKLAEPYVVALLTDLDPQLRLNAFNTLQGLGVDARPGLKKALENPDEKVRITTASLMVTLNLETALAEPVLVNALAHKDESLKMQAAYTLSQRGLREGEVLPIFIKNLANDVASVRRQAAEAIARYGVKASKATPDLVNALDDEDDSVCAQALATLRVIGADPKMLFPAMVKVLRRKDTSLHAAASQTIYQVGPDAIGEIVALLKKEDAPGVRLACLQTLAMVGPAAKEAVGVMTAALEDPSPQVRMTAARALGNIGPDAKAAEKALENATKDSDGNVQKIAQAALAQLRSNPKRISFEVNGVLTPGDPPDMRHGNHFHVVYVYRMIKGHTYTIDLRSPRDGSFFDPYLRLESPQGQPLAQDDDSGGNLNSRITYRAPEDGSYRIIVTTYAPGAHGQYTLTIR